MLSLYLHIPFCHYKCGYCNFNVIPLNSLNQEPDGIIQHYLDALHRQIDVFSSRLKHQEIRTIYFWGGTPSAIGSQELIKLIDHIAEVRDVSYVEELSIEINPDPVDDMLELVQTISRYYKHFPRVRFSIGIQSFDNQVLEEAGRQYNFQACVDFLRRLSRCKMDHNIFNFDFIAFGKLNMTRKGDAQLRDPAKLEFFTNFVQSGFADSFSLYTLELFEWSTRFNEQIAKYNYEQAWLSLKKYGTDEEVYAEFELLKTILLEAGYQRYEISNYSRAGANSIHNRIYRAMEERLGLGTGATSHLSSTNLYALLWDEQVPNATHSWHISIVLDLKRFCAGHDREIQTRINEKKTEYLSEESFLKEKFLMGMRTMEGVVLDEEARQEIYRAYRLQQTQAEVQTSITKHNEWDIRTILVDDWEEKVALYEEQGLCEWDGVRLKLTDAGMDVYNSIITELMK